MDNNDKKRLKESINFLEIARKSDYLTSQAIIHRVIIDEKFVSLLKRIYEWKEEDEKEMIVEEKKVDEKIKDLTERIKSSLIKTEEAQKELKIYQELKDQINFFYSEIKHSLKALHGLEKEDIFTLAKVEEESLRRRLSARMVKEKMKTEETERFLESKKLAELIFEKAFQG